MAMAGEPGWYFYLGDWALHDFMRQPEINDAALVASWENLIAHRQAKLKKLGAEYLVAIAPNKESLYPEYLPERIRERAGTPILAVMAARMQGSPLSDHFINLQEPLSQAKSKELLYYQTDSHWNSRGAYVAYRAILTRMQLWYPQIVPLAGSRIHVYLTTVSPITPLLTPGEMCNI